MTININIYPVDAKIDIGIAAQSFVDASLAAPQYWNLQVGGVGSANFSDAWNYATGRGVLVGIVDEGVNYGHLDLIDNYAAALDYDPRDAAGAWDARPDRLDLQHGTEVAGVIGGSAYNNIGTIGAAPNSAMTASYLRYGAEFSMDELVSIMGQQSRFDVSNNSWGFTSAFADNFDTDYFAGLSNGIAAAAATGRGGLGTVQVMAGGNGKFAMDGVNIGDDSNFHNLSNSRQVIAVGAHDAQGQAAFFSSPGTNILISAPGVGLVTTAGNAEGSQDVTYVSGTSFAAPLVSSAVALMLEVNPGLGYRDVQEILAIAANPSAAGTSNAAGNVNGGGMVFDREAGFGALDAAAAVNLARTWTGHADAHNEAHLGAAFDVSGSENALSTTVSVNVAPGAGKFALDFVELSLDVRDLDLKSLSIELISPNGTRSLIAPNLNAAGSQTALSFTFSSVATWGESPYGTWTLKLSHPQASRGFEVLSAGLDLYGDTRSANDTHYFTAAFAGLVTADPRRGVVADHDGGTDTLNFAAAKTAAIIDLATGAGQLAGKAITLSGAFENAIGTVQADQLSGSDAANVLTGDYGYDTIAGRAGDDVLHGGVGNDRLDGGAGADLLDGGAGFDTASYASATVPVVLDLISGLPTGDAAGDIFSGIEGFALTAGADRFGGSEFGETVFGDAGNDWIEGRGGNDRLDGGAGSDHLAGGAGNDTYIVDRASDVVVESGGYGHDTVNAAASYRLSANVEDLLLEGRGNFSGRGNALANTITGNAGNNVLSGLAGNDRLVGGAGRDRLDGGRGGDSMAGGTGNDSYLVDSARDRVVERAHQGVDSVFSSISYKLGAAVENLTLTGRASVAHGNALANTITGNTRSNLLDGGQGNDKLVGGGGNDKLVGGLGRDWLSGGAGRDTFDFNSRKDSLASAPDTISDFRHGQDRIDLRTMDSNSARGGNQAFRFIGDDGFSHKAGELRVDHVGKKTVVQADINGDGHADFTIHLKGHITLTGSDFML